jgi:hypothetical protein
MTIFDGFFQNHDTFNIHSQGVDTHFHSSPNGMGGHTLTDQGGHILGHQSTDALGHNHFTDPHGFQTLETHADALGHTIINDAHGMHLGTVTHGPLGDLFMDGAHLGQLSHDIHMHPTLNVDPFTHMDHFRFPHFNL